MQPTSAVTRDNLLAARLVLAICQDGVTIAGSIYDYAIRCAVIVGERESKPMSVKAVAAFIGLPRSTAQRHVQRLIKGGFIVSAKVKRSKVLRTTEHGRIAARHFSRMIKLVARTAREATQLSDGPASSSRCSLEDALSKSLDRARKTLQERGSLKSLI
jgi:DNA-binding MarR family transcriptional regulator